MTQPAPEMIGGIAKPPLAILPDPATLFASRARRFAFLAGSGNLAPYLAFLGDLSALQDRLLADLPPLPAPDAVTIQQARAARMPPLDRAAMAADPALDATLTALCAGAAGLTMPDPARAALAAVTAAPPEDRRWLLTNVLADTIPPEAAAAHLFAAAAVHLHMARAAATLPADQLVVIATGICPACGGRPGVSVVTAAQGIENLRYACCATCATQWNEVRLKCLSCGSTKGISFRSVEDENAAIKAETCSECGHWLKVMYRTRNASLDPLADDVASLGLDIAMQSTGLRRAGVNVFTAGW